jgi:hypothetical protein
MSVPATHAVVIEQDAEIAQHLLQVLAYLDLPARQLTVEADWSALLGAGEPRYLLMLGQCGSDAATHRVGENSAT